MPNIRLIFAHGFAMPHFYFQELSSFFPEYSCLYLKQSQPLTLNIASKSGTYYIGIGHSLGFTKLLDYDLDYYIGLSAFINFKNTALLKETINSFKQHPLQTLEKFYKSVGYNLTPQCMQHNTDLLWEDLHILQRAANLQRIAKLSSKMHIFLSKRDVIINSSHTEIELQKLNINYTILQHTKHNLGCAKTVEIANAIKNIINAQNFS